MIDGVRTWETVLSRIDVRSGMVLARSRPAREVFRDGSCGGLWTREDVVQATRSVLRAKVI